MTSKNFIKPSLTFIIGIVFGISIFASYAFILHPESNAINGQGQIINLSTASKYTKNYVSSTGSMNSIFKGFAVNKDQLNAMNSLNTENSRLNGFRVYMGKDDHGSPLNIVVGINEHGSDVTSGLIYSTPSYSCGPCPNVCDSASPL